MKRQNSTSILAKGLFNLAIVTFASAGLALATQNLVYINGNITATGQNAVIGLVNDGAGNLTPLSGSPFATGGTGVAGTGDPLDDAQWDSDGEVVINATGTLLYAVNGHSNNFSGFNINADGTLSLIAGSPFTSGGTQPASIGYRDNAFGNGNSMLAIANKDSDPFQTQTAPSYVSFRVDSAGVPTMNPGSTFALPSNSSPSQIMMPKKGTQFFFGVEFKGQRLSSYSFTRGGIMSTVSSLATIGSPVGGVIHPRSKTIYLTIASRDKLSVFTYDNNFNLTAGRTLGGPGDAPCWATTNKAGTHLYIGETLSGSVTAYDISDPVNPVQLQHLVLQGDLVYATHVHLDVTERFLYCLDRTGVLHVMDVAADGTLTENHTPYSLGLPADTVPLGVVVLRK